MKRLIITIAAALLMGIGTMQAQTTITRQGNTFVATKTTKEKPAKESTYYPTNAKYMHTDGKTYQIFTHTITRGENKGKEFCYIKMVAEKSGNERWEKIKGIDPAEAKAIKVED